MAPTSTLSAFKEELDSMVGGHLVDEDYLTTPDEEDELQDELNEDDWDESEEERD